MLFFSFFIPVAISAALFSTIRYELMSIRFVRRRTWDFG
jgi:hypothetical protein